MNFHSRNCNWFPNSFFSRRKRIARSTPARLRDSVTRFFASGIFLESVSQKPLIIPLGSFQIFSKILGDIRSSRFATGVNDAGGKFAAGIVDNGGKFATGINNTSENGVVDTGGKFATGVVDTGGAP